MERKKSSISMTDCVNDELNIDQQLSSFSPKTKIKKDEEEEKKTVINQPKAAHVQQPQSNADRDLQVTGFMVFGDQETTTMY